MTHPCAHHSGVFVSSGSWNKNTIDEGGARASTPRGTRQEVHTPMSTWSGTSGQAWSPELEPQGSEHPGYTCHQSWGFCIRFYLQGLPDQCGHHSPR